MNLHNREVILLIFTLQLLPFFCVTNVLAQGEPEIHSPVVTIEKKVTPEDNNKAGRMTPYSSSLDKIFAHEHYLSFGILLFTVILCIPIIRDIVRKPPVVQGELLPIGIEAVTVVLIVVSVVILALSKTITSEGTVGILASIVGYILGKEKAKQGVVKEEGKHDKNELTKDDESRIKEGISDSDSTN